MKILETPLLLCYMESNLFVLIKEHIVWIFSSQHFAKGVLSVILVRLLCSSELVRNSFCNRFLYALIQQLKKDVFCKYASDGHMIADFKSLLMYILCASSNATECHSVFVMLTVNPPFSRLLEDIVGYLLNGLVWYDSFISVSIKCCK